MKHRLPVILEPNLPKDNRCASVKARRTRVDAALHHGSRSLSVFCAGTAGLDLGRDAKDGTGMLISGSASAGFEGATVDGRTPFHTALKPPCTPLLAFTGGSNHSVGFLLGGVQWIRHHA